ncbi:hypothetical protein Daus18300_004590 [Diaporthe australafricana]|uniref:AB hydrolase-1 domain-containing protein n=1 Tax=Diaporthe australafricana TaxID=127596 RepID=A0ABR3X7N7_9PEZI
MAPKQRLMALANGISLEVTDASVREPPVGIIVLLHGFPQTAYQFRHVIGPFTDAGQPQASPSPSWEKTSSNSWTPSKSGQRSHLVGHDFGGMIAWYIATRHPDRLETVNWGECTLLGTVKRRKRFINPDAPEALIAGREEIFLSYFFDKYAFNPSAIAPKDLDHYVKVYSKPGAIRCALELRRAFSADYGENHEWLSNHPKCRVPTIGMFGEKSIVCSHEQAVVMFAMVHEEMTYELVTVPDAGHYLAEENPEAFVDMTLAHIRRHQPHINGFHVEVED